MKRIFSVFLLCLSVLFISGSVAQSSRTKLDLRTGPIINSGDVSNLALILSVEFPTVGSAYKDGSSPRTYNPAVKYIGYYNSKYCYRYNGTSADGYFEPSGSTNSSYQCNLSGTGTGWSGNLMNFANTSSVDIMRLALTGGDRYVDESSINVTPPRTILQRAILPSDTTGVRNTNFYDLASNGDGYASNNHNWDKIVLPAGTSTAALTPFGPGTQVVIKACDDKIFFGNTDGGTCASPGANANLAVATTSSPSTTVTGSFKARVLVCDSTEGPARPDLCKQQGDGYYKPVGEVQRNADKVRVAAFGYLIDSEAWQTGNEGVRYGGVLRAPMKFVGPNQKSSAGIVSLNTQKEWDETTGVFILKPIDTANENGYTVTGVINYLNRFGRHNRSDGVGNDVYKRRDPVGELFYEGIRYFQGSQPTSTAVSNTTTALMAGYPMYANWTDPMQTSCQRNYAMIIGDNNTSRGGRLPGSQIYGQDRAVDTLTVGGNSVTLDAAAWAKVVSSFETNGTQSYTDSQGVSRIANGNAVSGATGIQTGNGSLDTLASTISSGVAYWANTQKIRPDKPLARVRTFVIDVNEGGATSLDRSRALYLDGKYGGFADVGADGSPATGEGNPFKTYVGGTLTTSDTEWLANDGTTSPSGYFVASQPERVILAIKKIFAAASKPSGNLAGGSLSVSRLSKAKQTGAFYQAQLDSSDWSGSVIRTELTFNSTTLKLEASPTPVWDAGVILTGVVSSTGSVIAAPYPLPANRKILSFSSTSLSGITFTWANLDSAVQTSLKTDPTSSIVEADADGQARLNYVRGDRTAETDLALNYRARKSIMGDSINSAPVLKGAPSSSIIDASYKSFYSANLGRTPTVYIGSNDGMLHAFSAAESKTDPDNGKELFAFVPRAVSTKLNKLTDPGYIKEAYVDGSLAVNEARIYKVVTDTMDWGTALVSGMGGGAKGLFALDVTSPTTFSKDNVLWEFTESDDADMGNLLSEPKIVKLAVNGSGNSSPEYKWFAMVTSGYNNYTSGGAADKQALFLLSLEKKPGAANPWVLGSNYYKMVADNSDFSSISTAATGMGMPGVAIGINGNAIFAYAGDLQGNLWRFDLRGSTSTWTGNTTTARKLFIAKNGAGTATQPITVVPTVTLNIVSGYQIGFGTGKFIEPIDALTSSAAQQTLYGIWDSDDGKTFQRIATGSGSPPSINGLISRTLTVTAGTITVSITGTPFSYGLSSSAGSNQYRGWFADLSTTMERVAVDPTVDSGLMAVNSTIPGGDPCVTTGGSNQYRYNPLTGFTFVTTGANNTQGYLGSASLLEVGDTAWTTRGASGRYLVTRKINSISPGVGGGLNTQESTVTSFAGRLSWREITNFQ